MSNNKTDKGKHLNLFTSKPKTKRKVNDNVFSYLQSANPDLTFVADERIFPEDVQTVTDEDMKTWKNFSERLGSLDPMQKRQLKELWIEGGRPKIKIEKKDSVHDGDKNRAWYGRWSNPKAEHRDVLHIFEHKLVGDFMAEISHGRMYARKSGESVDDWKSRRTEIAGRMQKAKKDFGEDVYGGWERGGPSKENKGKMRKWFPYMGHSQHFSIGEVDGVEIAVDEEGNVYPEMAVPQPKYRYNKKGEITGSSRNVGWAYDIPKKAIYDPERRKGFDEQRGIWIKPTTEFEAHSIIEDSLWGDYVNRFGKGWEEYGPGWSAMDWKQEHGVGGERSLQELIDMGLVE